METARGTFKAYIVGLGLSIVLTLAAYFAVIEQIASRTFIIGTLVALGLAQAMVQMILFLHLGQEAKPRWNLLIFLFMVVVIVVVVLGSLWIMNNLNYRVMEKM